MCAVDLGFSVCLLPFVSRLVVEIFLGVYFSFCFFFYMYYRFSAVSPCLFPFHIFVPLVLIILLPFLPSHYLFPAPCFFSVPYVQIAYIWSSLNLSTRYPFALRFRVHAYRSFTNTKGMIYNNLHCFFLWSWLFQVVFNSRIYTMFFIFVCFSTVHHIGFGTFEWNFWDFLPWNTATNTCLSLISLVMYSSINSGRGQMGFFLLLFYLYLLRGAILVPERSSHKNSSSRTNEERTEPGTYESFSVTLSVPH